MTDAIEQIDLTGYQIVIPGNSTDNNSVESLSAYELKDALTGLGYTLNVVADNGSSSVNAKSILIGKTAATAGDMPTGNQFSITEDNGTVQISASNYYGYRAALAYLKSKIAQSKGLPQALDYSGDANVAHAERPAESSIRVMFSNVFGWNNWPKAQYDANNTPLQQNGQPATSNNNVYKPSQSVAFAPPENLRQDLQRDLFATYLPDVVGFQEYMSYEAWSSKSTSISDYHGNFTAQMVALGYTKVNAGGPNGNELKNCTPMFYNANKLEVLDCGFFLYSETNDDWQSKGVTWAVFCERSSGKLFSVFNTHFAHESGEVGDLAREDNAKEFLEVMNSVLNMKAEYNDIPVIMGGDLNFWNIWGNYDAAQYPDDAEHEATRLSETKPYTALVNGGMTAAFNVSGVQTNGKTGTANYTNSYHGYHDYDATKKIYDTDRSTTYDGYTLDYIFVENESGMTVQRYYVLEDDLTARASDHCPTLIDFVLK